MNENFLKVLMLLIREPNLSTVAEKIGATQSSLSKLLKRMEEEWGVKLFERKGFRGLHPTSEALRLAQVGEQLSKEWSINLNLVKNANITRPDLRVIAPLIWSQNFFLPYWYSSAWAKDYRLIMTISPLGEINLKTVGANYDIVISHSKSYLESYLFKKMLREKYILIFNRKKAPTTLKDLKFEKYQWLAYRAENDLVQDYLKSQGQSFDLIHSYVNDLSSLVDLVKSHPQCVACVPDHLYERNKTELVGHELPLKESGELFYFYKSGHTISKKIFEELKAPQSD